VSRPASARALPDAARGQLIELPPGEYDWLVLRFAPQPSTEDEVEVEDVVWLHYADAADPEWLRRPAGVDECRIPVPRHAPLVGIRLPDRPALRVLRISPVPASVPMPRRGGTE
jgi:hypothetical protein